MRLRLWRGQGKITKGGANMKVADLTTDELKELIGKTIEEKFRELIDPDFGLELREDFVQAPKAGATEIEKIGIEAAYRATEKEF